MHALTARRAAAVIGAGSVALMIAQLSLEFADRHTVMPPGWQGWSIPNEFGNVINIAVPVVGLVLATRRPANRIGWLFLVAGLALGVTGLGSAYGLRGLVAAPGSLPAARTALWLNNWAWTIPFAALSFLFLLFPTGRLRSRRWLPAAWLVGASFAVLAADMLVSASLGWSHPLRATQPFFGPALLIILTVALVISAAAAITRYAGSAGEERLQLKWFAAAALVLAAAQVFSFWNDSVAVSVLSNLAFLGLWAAIAIAVLKYRLYEIDIVISKAVLYGGLAVFITAVYAGLVAGVGTLAGSRLTPLLSAVAAAVVAIAFQPARQRAERLANRVVYGRRATPYEVLSDFTRRIRGAYSSEDVLPQMARVVAAGTGAEQVVVWLRVGHELRPAASSGKPAAAGPAVLMIDGDALPALPGTGLSVPVTHHGELLGAIAIRMPRDEQLRPAGEHLVTDVASQAGLVLANAGLIEDLRASRQRLVRAQDEARRRLERNLHDGAQQDLVALSIKLGLAASALGEDPAQAAELIGELRADAAGALANLRDLARGIYPPTLADRGVVAALSAQAGKFSFPVTVEAGEIGRSTADAEAAVYFCCLEALQNTSKYAGPAAARVRLRAQHGSLSFTASDDGAGYDSRHTPMGAGLRNMADRLAALGGTFEVRSAPGQGTTITGQLPFPPAPASAPAAAG